MPGSKCQHCEQRPAVEVYGLCEKCGSREALVDLYHLRPHHTPAFLAKLLRMRRKAERQEPLFTGEDANYPIDRPARRVAT